MNRRGLTLLAIAVAALAIGIAAFFAVRSLKGSGGSSPEASGQETPTTEARMAPTRGPGWWEPYLQEDTTKPRLSTQAINGIRVGPDSDLFVNPEVCGDAQAESVPFERAAGTATDFVPSYLPEGVELVPETVGAWACGDAIVSVQKSYHVPTVRNPDGPYTLVWPGGTIVIIREMKGSDSYPLYGAAERIGPATIAGMPAVLERPVTPDGVDNGISDATLVIKDSFGLTVVEGGGLPLVEFTKIAGSLY